MMTSIGNMTPINEPMKDTLVLQMMRQLCPCWMSGSLFWILSPSGLGIVTD